MDIVIYSNLGSFYVLGCIWRRWHSIPNWWNYWNTFKRLSLCNTSLCSGTICHCIIVSVGKISVSYIREYVHAHAGVILLHASLFFQTFKLQKLSLNVTTPNMQNGVIFVESETWKWDLLNHFWKKIMKIFYFLPVLWGSLISLNMIVKCYHGDVMMYVCLCNAQISCLCLVSVDIVHINIRTVVRSYCWWSMVASLTPV